MSSCSSDPLTSRRKVATIAASLTVIAAGAPVLLRHSGPSDWSDNVLGLVVGLALGIGIVMVVVAVLRVRNTS
jgi:hypothetical protein